MLWRSPLACLVLAGAALAPPAAFAHRLRAFAAAEGSSVTGYAYFVGGGRAEGVAVELRDEMGASVASSTTAADGTFALTPPAGRVAALVVVDGGDGHRATYRLLEGGGEDAGANPGRTGTDGATASMPDLDRRLEAAVERAVRPLREQLDRYEATVRLRDVLGGLGMIFGLAGLSLWWQARAALGKRPPA